MEEQRTKGSEQARLRHRAQHRGEGPGPAWWMTVWWRQGATAEAALRRGAEHKAPGPRQSATRVTQHAGDQPRRDATRARARRPQSHHRPPGIRQLTDLVHTGRGRYAHAWPTGGVEHEAIACAAPCGSWSPCGAGSSDCVKISAVPHPDRTLATRRPEQCAPHMRCLSTVVWSK